MSILKNLVGTSWSLESYQSENKEGEIIFPLGEHAQGTIIFTNEEQTAVQIMANNRDEKITKEEIDSYNTEIEKEMARLGYHAYSGPFTVDEESSILTTHVTLSLISDYVGSKQARKATIDGDLLRLSNINHPERKLVWKRIENKKG